jgi:dUTP pyrophosphatase
MHLKIKIEDNNHFLKQLYQKHNSFHPGDSGLDIFTPEEIIIQPHSKGTINTGISCEAFFYDTPTSFWMLPRSSVATKTPLILANSMGLIDAGYRGNLMGIFYNTSDKPFVVEKGSRILQICGPLLSEVTFELVEVLSETSRGKGGYGSTGK